MFGIDFVGSAWRVGGAAGAGAWGAMPIHAGEGATAEKRRKHMGLAGLGLLLFSSKLPASLRPAAVAFGSGCLAIYVEHTIFKGLITRADDGTVPTTMPAALALGVKTDFGLTQASKAA